MAMVPAVSEFRITPDVIRNKKSRQRITFVTAYDFPTAKLADEAGFDMVLVGDTLAEVVLGHETTLPVTFETMLHHTTAARRGIKRALLVADLPYGTYHTSDEDAVRFAVRFVKEAGAQAVKLEGGRKRVNQYLHGVSEIGSALSRFKADIESGAYPTDAESYHLPGEIRLKLPEIIERLRSRTNS